MPSVRDSTGSSRSCGALDAPAAPKSWSDGIPVGVVAGSTGQTAAPEYGARVIPYENLKSAIEALYDGRIEAVVHDAPALRYYVNQKSGSWAAVVGKTFKPQLYAFAVSEGSALREPLNRAILALQEDGTLDDLTRKWFGTDRE